MKDPLVDHTGTRLTGDGAQSVTETLAEESAIALLFNGVPYAVMMATPADLHDFALGFALSEGIIESADELDLLDTLSRPQGLALHISIPKARFVAIAQRRNLVGMSGCGLCGAESLAEAIRPPRSVPDGGPLAASLLNSALRDLHRLQPMNERCGALHAAAALVEGSMLVREDVGRHNAVDKVVGALARSGQRADALLVTSRASFELVHKAASAQIPILAAVSAPTAHAVRLAQTAGMTLVGFAREGRMTVYCGLARLQADFG